MTRKKKVVPQQGIIDKRIIYKDPAVELVLRQTPTKDLVAFDFGLLFTKGTDDVQLYIDDHLREALQGLLETHGQVILKVNAFSPDVIMVAADNASVTSPETS